MVQHFYVLAYGNYLYDWLYLPWHVPPVLQIVSPVHCAVVVEHLQSFVVLSQTRAELAA